MRVSKRKSEVPHRDVAILLDKDTILLEDGIEWPYAKTFDDTKIFASRKVIDSIWNGEKLGEILRYDGDIVKWRLECPKKYKRRSWPNHPKEVTVTNSRSFPDDPHKAIEAYALWRDWVEENGGHISGSLANTSMTIFKATIPGEKWETPYVGLKSISHPLGGRLLPCKELRTTFKGALLQWDLYAAYSRKLAGLQVGGINSRWIQTRKSVNFDKMVDKGMLVYIHAKVKIPEMNMGPLPKRRQSYHPRPIYNISFPTKRTIQGTWTYEEIVDAISVGCKVTILDAWIHIATGQKYYFQDWYYIIDQGRKTLEGHAQHLAKFTGNTLWGRFAMRIRPSRTVWRENGKRVSEKRSVRTFGGRQCMELADQLCGKIRSDLFRFAISADNLLLQGNTDGAWIEYDQRWKPPNDDWRIKREAERLDILDDATYRYWETGEGTPTYIVPGVNTEYAERYFDRQWEKYATT